MGSLANVSEQSSTAPAAHTHPNAAPGVSQRNTLWLWLGWLLLYGDVREGLSPDWATPGRAVLPCKGPCGATTYSVRGPEFQGALPSSPVNMLPQDTQLLRRDRLHSQDGSRSWRGSNNQLKLTNRICPELQVSLLTNCSCLVY